MDYAYYAPPVTPYQFFGLPGKPEHPYTPQEDLQNNPLDVFHDPNAFQYFDQTAFNPNTITAPPQSPPHSLHRPSISNALPYESSGSISHEGFGDPEYDQNPGRAGSSDDDKDNLTPAQSRRKAQNRAAQRAFRERKERHVKDLEVKLKTMEAHSTDLMSDNERLKRELDRVATQNEILRATTTPMRLSNHEQVQTTQAEVAAHSPEAGMTSGPMIYSPSTFNAAFADHHIVGPEEPISHRIAISATTGERLLATGSAWELIQGHELYRMGKVDLGEVCDRLREKVLCDGAGPTFAESEVIKAIEDSVGTSGDELI